MSSTLDRSGFLALLRRFPFGKIGLYLLQGDPEARMIGKVLERYSARDHSVIGRGGGYGIFASESVKEDWQGMIALLVGAHT